MITNDSLIISAQRNLEESKKSLSEAKTDETMRRYQNNVDAYSHILTELIRLREITNGRKNKEDK